MSCFRCKKNPWHVESNYILQPPKYLIINVNWFRFINNNVTKGAPCLWFLICLVSINSACRLPYVITDHLCILAIILPLSTVAKKTHSIATTAKLRSWKWSAPKTPLLLMWQCMNWLHKGTRTKTGGWEFKLLPWRWHILSIPLKTGRAISAETNGLDDVFPPDDLGSGPCTPFVIHIPYIIAAFLVIKIHFFLATYIPDVVWPCWCIRWFDTVIVSCLVSSVHFSCIVQYSLYDNMDIGTMWHCTLVSSTPSQSIGLFFGVCVVLTLSVIRCSCYYFLDRILFHHDFHHDSCDYHWDFYGHSLLFELHSRLSVAKEFWFCKCTTPWMFPPLDILLEYLIEHVTFGDLNVMFTFLTRIFYRGVPGFATDCPGGVWWRGLTTCLMYVAPLFGNLV